jgi:hypothetical protein
MSSNQRGSTSAHGSQPVLDGQVECRSEYTYAQRPVAFLWQGERLEVEEVQASWQHPQGKKFLIRTRDDRIFELTYNELNQDWHIQLQ